MTDKDEYLKEYIIIIISHEVNEKDTYNQFSIISNFWKYIVNIR